MARFKEFFKLRPWERHSLVLSVFGVYFIAQGLLVLTFLPEGPRFDALIAARRWFSLEAWAFIFILVGCFSIVSSRWPSISDKWGYMLLTGFSAGWGAFYLVGVLLYDADHSFLSYVLIWWALAFSHWAISGLVNPDRRMRGRNGPD